MKDDCKSDIDSTSQCHIYSALRRAITSEQKRKDEYGCTVSNLEINALNDIIHNNKRLQNIIENSKSKQSPRFNKETVTRPKILQQFSNSKVVFTERSSNWVKRNNKKTRESYVTLSDEINLEPNVVSPFYKEMKRKQSAHSPRKPKSRSSNTTTANTFLPDIHQRKNVRSFQQIKRKRSNSVKRIDITLPSIFDDSHSEFEKNQQSLSRDHFESDENFHQVVKNILSKTTDSLPLPRKKINLSHVYRVFTDDIGVQSSRDEMTKLQKKQAHDAIARYYNLKEELENHSIVIIHLPKPELSLGGTNNVRASPKLFMRTSDEPVYKTMYHAVRYIDESTS